MTIEQQVIEKLRGFHPQRQEEVLDLVDFLKEKGSAERPRHSLLGKGRLPRLRLATAPSALRAS